MGFIRMIFTTSHFLRVTGTPARVVSDQYELVSGRTATLSLMLREDRATRRERRHGWT